MLTLLKKERFIFSTLFLLCVFLTFNKHSKDKANTYHGVIWADAAGYYVYQPMWFIYGNKATNFPDSIDVKTGNGFQLDFVKNKVLTKYPSGVALLQTPFFLICHALAKPLGFKPDGFSKIYSFGLYFSGIIYCCLGMFLLSVFLQKHFNSFLSIATVFIFFITTNLYYYAIDSPAMSHVYSFFLFALFIYSTQKLLESERLIHYLFFTSALALVILTRPTNALIILFPLVYENGAFIHRIKVLIKQKKKLIYSFFVAVIILIPQLAYWKSTFGNALTYSYGNESFSNWNHPKLMETWFSPNNGLFTYAPILLLSIIGLLLMISKKNRMGYFLLFIFLVISYVFASWWNWWFGCSLGARSFVEYYVLLSIPMAYTIQAAWKNKPTKIVLIAFIGLCSFHYFNIEYYYDGCFYSSTWDWNAYLKLLEL